MASVAKTISGKIRHNSFWYGLETVLETIIFFGTSVAVARYMGPQKMGYFSYINLFVVTITRTSGSGLASATRKYMSEFLALDKPGVARGIYHLAHRYQLIGATAISTIGVIGIILFGEPGYKMMACILIVAIIPGVMSWVPAQANNAFEDVAPNTISAFGYLVSYGLVTFLAIFFHWDLVGIASATLIGRTVEVLLRTYPLNAKLRKIPLDPITPDIVQRIRDYCLQAAGIQLLVAIVWDRSEMLFLRHYSTLTQISYYSISINLTNNLLMIPRTFGAATGISLMVEAGRDARRVDGIVKNACRYLLFAALPVHLGAVAITRAAIGAAYGDRYISAVPVMIIASILAIPRAFQEISETLMRAADRQRQLLIALSFTAVFNLGVDWYLIPRFGPVGAAWGNGISQSLAILVVWQLARRAYDFSFPMQSAIRISAASLIMAAITFFIGRKLPGLPGLIIGVSTAVPIYLGLIRLFHGLDASDRVRLEPVGSRLPAPARRAYDAAIAFITPQP